jgi:predicted metalloprotease with PDZ domain
VRAAGWLFLIAATPLFAQQTVHYDVRFPNAAHHEAEVRATFENVPAGKLEVRMSRSSPGRYALHEFAKNVYNVRVSDGSGHALEATRPDPYGWDVAGHHGTVVFEYTLYGDRVDGTYAAIDLTHAHLNMPATLVWARGYEQAPVSVRFEIPAGSNWRAATELKPEPDGSWSAPNLEQLMDGPVELSAHAQPEWQIDGQTFRLALHHQGTDAEAQAYAEMCKRVVLEEAGVFGRFPKYDTGTYTFLVDYLPYASGDGMEHRDSTVISSKGDLKTSWSSLIETVSHEFFHSWNVRRIRPRSLEPFDFDRVDMSGELWFAEGFTNYYGMLALERAGFTKLDEFAGQMGWAVNRVLTAPGRKVHSAVDMSRLAPFVDAAKSIDPNNFTNTFISYYTYGQALAFGIDLEIREHYPGKSLDDWMRAMWREHPDIDKPYTLKDLESTLAEVTDADFAANIFARHIEGLEPLDYAALVSAAGLELRPKEPQMPWLGAAKLDYSSDGAKIDGPTLRGSTLYNAGLDDGDRIVRWDNKSLANESAVREWLAKHKAGEQVSLQVRRRAGLEQSITATLVADPTVVLVSYESEHKEVTPAMKAFRAAWLSSKAIHPLSEIPAMP